MTVEEIKKQANAAPFEPFDIRLADGRAVPVMHPDFIAFSPTGRLATVFGLDDTSQTIDVALVLSLEKGARPPKVTQRSRKKD